MKIKLTNSFIDKILSLMINHLLQENSKLIFLIVLTNSKKCIIEIENQFTLMMTI